MEWVSLYTRYLSSTYNFKFCVFQQQLLLSSISEFHSRLAHVTTALNAEDFTDAKALMLNQIAHREVAY
jgi:hypothetical protein